MQLKYSGWGLSQVLQTPYVCLLCSLVSCFMHSKYGKNCIKITIHVILGNYLVVILDNACKRTVRVIQLGSLLKCVTSTWWLGVRKHLLVIMHFRSSFLFFPAFLYLPQGFSTTQTSERIGWEGTSLSHTHSLLLENSFPPLPLPSHPSSVWKNKVWRNSLHANCPDVNTQYQKLQVGWYSTPSPPVAY